MQRIDEQAAEKESPAQAGEITALTPITFAAMHGLSAGGKVRENQLFELSMTGIKFHGSMSWDRWLDLLRMIRQAKEASTLWMADTLKQGVLWFGSERVNGAVVQLQFDLADAHQAFGIGELGDGVRRDALTTEHYWVLSKAELSGAEQLKWADLAEKHVMSAELLAHCIDAGKVMTAEALADQRGSRSGVLTMQGLAQQFQMYLRVAQKEHPIAEWPREDKLRLFNEIKGPAMLGVKLSRELGISLEE